MSLPTRSSTPSMTPGIISPVGRTLPTVSRRDFLAATCALLLPQRPKAKVGPEPVSAISPIRFREIAQQSGLDFAPSEQSDSAQAHDRNHGGRSCRFRLQQRRQDRYLLYERCGHSQPREGLEEIFSTAYTGTTEE